MAIIIWGSVGFGLSRAGSARCRSVFEPKAVGELAHQRLGEKYSNPLEDLNTLLLTSKLNPPSAE